MHLLLGALATVVVSAPTELWAEQVSPTPVHAGAGADLRLIETKVVSSSDAGTYLHIESRFAVGPDGSVYAGRTYDPGSVARFAPGGSFDGLIGGAGDGPGEIRVRGGVGVLDVVTASGNLLVQSLGDQLSVFTASGEFVRSFRLPRDGRISSLTTDGRLLTAQMDGGEVVVADESGALVRAIPVGRGRRVLAPASADGLWSSPFSTSTITKHGPDGRLLLSLELPLPSDVAAEAEGTPLVVDLAEDASSTLWVIAFVRRIGSAPTVGRAGAEMVVSGPGGRPDIESVRIQNQRLIHLLYAYDGSGNLYGSPVRHRWNAHRPLVG